MNHPTETPSSAQPHPSSQQRRRIVLAAEDDVERTTMVRQLEALGYDVAAFVCEAEMVEALAFRDGDVGGRADIVIDELSDEDDSDGDLFAVEALRAGGCADPVIVVAHHTSGALRERIEALDDVALLLRPVRIAELAELLRVRSP